MARAARYPGQTNHWYIVLTYSKPRRVSYIPALVRIITLTPDLVVMVAYTKLLSAAGYEGRRLGKICLVQD
jgi:hypothetical protein